MEVETAIVDTFVSRDSISKSEGCERRRFFPPLLRAGFKICRGDAKTIRKKGIFGPKFEDVKKFSKDYPRLEKAERKNKQRPNPKDTFF